MRRLLITMCLAIGLAGCGGDAAPPPTAPAPAAAIATLPVTTSPTVAAATATAPVSPLPSATPPISPLPSATAPVSALPVPAGPDGALPAPAGPDGALPAPAGPDGPLPEPAAASATALWRLGGATGTEDTEGPQFTELGGLAVGNGLLYVADAYGGVFTFDMAGGYEGVISAGEIMYITDVAVGPAGEVYIADAGLHQVTRFSAEHDLLGGFGAYGAGDGEFGSDGPAALAVGPGGEVFALDPNVDAAGAGLMRVQVFGPEGDFRRAFPAEPGPDAADLAVGPDGTLFIVSRQGYVAEVEPEAGRLIQRIGSAALDSGALVGAAFPQGIALDAAGNLFLTTQAPAAVAVLGATGHRLEARIGVETVRTEEGWPAGELFMPRGIAVTGDGARVFVAESAAGFTYVTAFAR